MDAGWDKYSSNTVKGEEELTHWDHGFSDAIWDPQYLLIPGKTVLSITITPLASLPHCSQHVSSCASSGVCWLLPCGCLSTLAQDRQL